MAKPVRGLPSGFSLDIPDDGPVVIGDFLDEVPAPVPQPRRMQEVATPQVPFRPEIVPERVERPLPQAAKKVVRPSVIRCQLNLTPRSKAMLEEVVEYVQTYSPESDARTSEVFQAIIGLVHGTMDKLDLAEIPRRGAWGSVTAKNFPGALGEAFEAAILRAARSRRGIE
ncbi:hypothetical protein F183_A21300 [Bryobacterales bacterium F-183]|nr:hypothetical protein F183_A21300 [Bryobacterales bacterium F-183]